VCEGWVALMGPMLHRLSVGEWKPKSVLQSPLPEQPLRAQGCARPSHSRSALQAPYSACARAVRRQVARYRRSRGRGRLFHTAH
jgi:hypothetical protein